MAADRRSRLIGELAELVQTLQQQDTDVDTVLRELTQSAVKIMPGAQSAAITIASRDRTVRTASATNRYPVLLDQIQQRHDQGPCLSAVWEQHVVRINDTSNQSWPRPETVRDMPSTVIEPFSTTYRDSAVGSAIRTTSQCSDGVRAIT